MDIFNAVWQKAMHDTRLAPVIGKNIEKWMEKLWNRGWLMLLESTPREEVCCGFMIAFCSPWQCKVPYLFFSIFFKSFWDLFPVCNNSL
jgi:hypothetical protein